MTVFTSGFKIKIKYALNYHMLFYDWMKIYIKNLSQFDFVISKKIM